MNDTPSAKPPLSRRWRLLTWLLTAALALALGIYCTRGFWLTTLRAYAIGRLYIAGQDYGVFLPEPDEVEVLALSDKDVPAGTADAFPGDMGQLRGTVNRRTLRGADASDLATLWRHSVGFSPRLASNCHAPIYALRFRSEGKLICQVSICWRCGTYEMPVGPFGNAEYVFDPKAESAQNLLAALTRHAPRPEAEPHR